jgi:ribosomal protein S18 acetylase RimI-like enzyme
LSYDEHLYDKIVYEYKDNTFFGKFPPYTQFSQFLTKTQKSPFSPISHPKTAFNPKLALVNDVPVGAISCRIWPRAEEGELKDKKCLYIIILSVLPSYRRYGIASKLLEEATRRAQENNENLYSVYLHTPETNEMAIKFYERNGYEVKETHEGYYKSLGPEHGKDAIVLEKLFPQTESQVEEGDAETNE